MLPRNFELLQLECGHTGNVVAAEVARFSLYEMLGLNERLREVPTFEHNSRTLQLSSNGGPMGLHCSDVTEYHRSVLSTPACISHVVYSRPLIHSQHKYHE